MQYRPHWFGSFVTVAGAKPSERSGTSAPDASTST
jgi:hypothetical protein